MKITKLITLFLVINFLALYLGNLLMDNGPQNFWYLNLNKAPWTPQGWVFGAAWSTIMLTFSVYMAFLINKNMTESVINLFTFQFVLNVIWSFIFFKLQLTVLGLITITLLTFIIFYFLFRYFQILKLKSLLILPYGLWLIIATSLNLYIVLYN